MDPIPASVEHNNNNTNNSHKPVSPLESILTRQSSSKRIRDSFTKKQQQQQTNGASTSQKKMGGGEAKLPTNNFLLIKKVVDDPDTGGLTLVGTFVQSVFFPDQDIANGMETGDNGNKSFRFQYRFGDETETDDNVQLRRTEPLEATTTSGQKMTGVRSTLQAKIPLQIETVLEAFPFHVLTATADIELSSTFQDGQRLRPDLILSRKDRRGNVCLQDLKTTKAMMGNVSLSDILDKIDKTVQYDFVSPFPQVEYEFDVKKQYCARYTVTFYCIKGGFTKFMTIILPIILIAVINTINVFNDAFDFGDGPIDTADHLGISSALALTAVFLLPSIIEPNTRQAFMRLDNLYIVIIFLSLMLSSFPKALTGTRTVEVVGMVGLWVSFISPVFNCIRFLKFLLQNKAKSTAVLENSSESNPFLKDNEYTPWKPKAEPFDESFCTVNQIVNEMDEASRTKIGYTKQEERMGKFEVVKYT